VELVPVKSIIPAADASAAPASKSAIAVIGAAKNRIIVSPSKKIDSTKARGHICGRFASHGPVREAMPGDWRYQIGNPICRKSISQTGKSSCGAGPRCRLLL
jgi:hypothetical protein